MGQVQKRDPGLKAPPRCQNVKLLKRNVLSTCNWFLSLRPIHIGLMLHWGVVRDGTGGAWELLPNELRPPGKSPKKRL